MASSLALFVAIITLAVAQDPTAPAAASTTAAGTNAAPQASLADCKLASTSVTPPAISGLPQPEATVSSYCDCAGGIKAPLATTTSADKIYTVCAAAPSPIMASSSAQNADVNPWNRLINVIVSAANYNASSISAISEATKAASTTSASTESTTGASTGSPTADQTSSAAETSSSGSTVLTTTTANQTTSATGMTTATSSQTSATGGNAPASTTGSTSTHAGAPVATAVGTLFALGGFGAMVVALA